MEFCYCDQLLKSNTNCAYHNDFTGVVNVIFTVFAIVVFVHYLRQYRKGLKEYCKLKGPFKCCKLLVLQLQKGDLIKLSRGICAVCVKWDHTRFIAQVLMPTKIILTNVTPCLLTFLKSAFLYIPQKYIINQLNI